MARKQSELFKQVKKEYLEKQKERQKYVFDKKGKRLPRKPDIIDIAKKFAGKIREQRENYKKLQRVVNKPIPGTTGWNIPSFSGRMPSFRKNIGKKQKVSSKGVGRPSGLFKPRIDPRTGQVVRMPALQFNAMIRNWRAMQKARIERAKEQEKLRQIAMVGRQQPQNPQFQPQQQQFQRMPKQMVPMPQRMQPQPFRRQFIQPQFRQMRQNMPMQRYPIVPVQPPQEFVEDQDLMTGRRFLRLKPQKEAWLQ